MLGFVDIIEMEAEKGIGKISGDCGVRKVAVDDEDGQQAEQKVEAQRVEASECIQRPDNAIFILYT